MSTIEEQLDRIQQHAEHTLRAFCAVAGTPPQARFVLALRKLYEDVLNDSERDENKKEQNPDESRTPMRAAIRT